MRRVGIGIHVDDQPERAGRTLASLRAHTAIEVELLLLLDGVDGGACALPPTEDVVRLASVEQIGRAGWFNRLHRASAAEVIVLIESGCIVAPGWLDRLLIALGADPRHGLAGPSTNRAWNEQCAFPGVIGDPGAIAAAANAAASLVDEWRTLEPLHSLGDFCYAVKRQAVDAIGDADERYGPGPCWEMDYNVRAARAGWHGVWARRAFVWRAPFTARRARDEQAHFERNKRLYQDKFCALRLRGERAGYEAHCRGESCEHFAPHALIEIARRERAEPVVATVAARASRAAQHAMPLVSCIMPTRDRTEFALQSVRYFLRQDYPARELIIVDDGDTDLERQLPNDARIRYARVGRGQSIGSKRNHGCELARGEIFLHWDDDDWYAPHRIGAQVAPILAGDADITGLITGVFLALDRWEFWRCSSDLHRRLFVHDVHGGTLAMHRRVWELGARYPNVSLAEDALFLREAVRRGARVARVAGDDLFVYLRHATNSWRFTCGHHIDPGGWTAVSEPPLLAADRLFYAERSPCAPAAAPTVLPDARGADTLVSCIMPTTNRRWFVPRAVEYFLRQDHAARELVVVDDGTDPVADLIPADPRIRYLRLSDRQTIGAKRNIACEEARGEIVVHWDDDDWSSPSRLTLQLAVLADNPGADICGLSELYFYEPGTRRSWRYSYRGARAWVSGNTLCYRRSAWRRRAFLAVDDGEDTRFVWSATPGSVLEMSNPAFFVGIVHGTNASTKRTTEASWHALGPSAVPALLGPDLTFYEMLGEPTAGDDAAAAARMAPFPAPRLSLNVPATVAAFAGGSGHSARPSAARRH